ncbi:MAG: hypothetical protein KGP29_03785 [Proteobacteria bacterium]|nr:hypothetical protein [Pseudomonadota bacterium]
MSEEMIHMINRAQSQAKRDAFFSFLGKNSKVVVKILFVLIAIGIITTGFTAYQKANQEKFSEILHLSLVDQQIGELEKSREGLKKIVESSSAPSGVKSLASLRYASLLLEENKKSEAAKIYLKIADCGSCDDYVRDLGRLLLVKVWMSDQEELSKPDLSDRIKKIEESADVLKYNIAEQRAFLALQQDKREEAKKIFAEIEKGSEKQPTLKNRAADGIKMTE